MNFKKWIKSIQTAGYNGARKVFGQNVNIPKWKGSLYFVNSTAYSSSKTVQMWFYKVFIPFHIKNLPNLSEFLENKSDSLGADFMKRFFFLTASIFETLYFLKVYPIFDELSAVEFTTYSGFLWVCWYLGKKLAF